MSYPGVSKEHIEKGFLTTATLAASPGPGNVFVSSVLSFDPESVSQVQTEVLADEDGTMLFEFYSDAAGTDIIRTLTIPYNTSDGYRQFSAPTFGYAVKYTFTNNGSAQSNFYFTTKLVRVPLSSQGLALDAFVSPTMMATLNRSVLSAANPAGNYSNVGINEAGDLRVAVSSCYCVWRDEKYTGITCCAD